MKRLLMSAIVAVLYAARADVPDQGTRFWDVDPYTTISELLSSSGDGVPTRQKDDLSVYEKTVVTSNTATECWWVYHALVGGVYTQVTNRFTWTSVPCDNGSAQQCWFYDSRPGGGSFGYLLCETYDTRIQSGVPPFITGGRDDREHSKVYEVRFVSSGDTIRVGSTGASAPTPVHDSDAVGYYSFRAPEQARFTKTGDRILTSGNYSESDPTVPAWAKERTPSFLSVNTNGVTTIVRPTGSGDVRVEKVTTVQRGAYTNGVHVGRGDIFDVGFTLVFTSADGGAGYVYECTDARLGGKLIYNRWNLSVSSPTVTSDPHYTDEFDFWYDETVASPFPPYYMCELHTNMTGQTFAMYAVDTAVTNADVLATESYVDSHSGGGGGGVDTNAVIDIVRETVDGSARPLPEYLHVLDFDDCYPEDAAWYYGQPHDYGSCSVMREGNFLYRNYDWKLDETAEFVVKVSAAPGRFASVGVANVGTNLTEGLVTGGKWSRYYKCLPGYTADGINDRGVVAVVNVVSTNGVEGWTGDPSADGIHCLGAVRWVLDNADSASFAAYMLKTRVYVPSGMGNFHYMVADGVDTYIVENGEMRVVTGKPVMTNFRLLPSPETDGAGHERYDYLEGEGSNITNVWYTKAYVDGWSSEFKTPQEKTDAMEAWSALGTKEARRAAGVFWQTVHTSIYDIPNKTLRIAVQETPDWYVFGHGGFLSTSGGTVDGVLAVEGLEKGGGLRVGSITIDALRDGIAPLIKFPRPMAFVDTSTDQAGVGTEFYLPSYDNSVYTGPTALKVLATRADVVNRSHSAASLRADLMEAATNTQGRIRPDIAGAILRILLPETSGEPHLAIIDGELHIITETENTEEQ